MIEYPERSPEREIKQDGRDWGPPRGTMLFYTDQPGWASMIWGTFKWGNGVRGSGGLVVTWAKSFLVQKDSQGKGPEAGVFLTCLRNS